MQNIMHMLCELTPDASNAREVYEELFEVPYLETSATYYKIKSDEFLATGTAAEYLVQVCVSCLSIIVRVATA